MATKHVIKPHVSECEAGGAHRYILSDPSGGIVGGGCLKCGKERTWNNAVHETWNSALTERQQAILHGGVGWDGYEKGVLADEVAK